MNKLFAFGLACSALWGAALAAEHTKDSLDTVKQNLAEKKAVIIDVREKSEWDQGHLEQATLVPWSELRKMANDPAVKEQITKQLPKDRIIYCHCAKGVRALMAGNLLEQLGLTVRPLEPGFEALREAGFPATGTPAPQK